MCFCHHTWNNVTVGLQRASSTAECTVVLLNWTADRTAEGTKLEIKSNNIKMQISYSEMQTDDTDLFQSGSLGPMQDGSGALTCRCPGARCLLIRLRFYCVFFHKGSTLEPTSSLCFFCQQPLSSCISQTKLSELAGRCNSKRHHMMNWSVLPALCIPTLTRAASRTVRVRWRFIQVAAC